ncbi:MAG: DUF4230 domain-containing protein [Bacteroidota bacterium]
MRKVLVGVVITLAVVLVVRSCWEDKASQTILEENTMLIEQQIQQVSKLVVTEGHFAEVYTYKDSQELFGPLFTAQKKALVVVNAQVTIAYDLSQVDYEIHADSKTLRIRYIPEPEITIHPDFEYYDVSSDYLNPFTASDYNLIKKNVNASLLKKVEASSLKGNARNRLLSELHKLFIVTQAMEWRLAYKGEPLQRMDQFIIKD